MFQFITNLLSLPSEEEIMAEVLVRTCRVCGCTESNACVNADGETCDWIEEDLCSACANGGDASAEELAANQMLENFLDQVRRDFAHAGKKLNPDVAEAIVAGFGAGWAGRSLFEALEDQGEIAIPEQPQLILPEHF
jgi:aspartate/methionine/tyrosine aminotransferase